MYQAGLVLEGGGMRGMYTAGVLDFFLDKEIEFGWWEVGEDSGQGNESFVGGGGRRLSIGKPLVTK